MRSLLLFALVLFTACSEDSFISTKNDRLLFSAALPESRIKNWNVQCEDSHQCPGFVGQIVIQKPEQKLGLCSGFLISPDTMVTNSHCIQEPTLCSSTVSVRFPKTESLPSEISSCERVLYQSSLAGVLTNPWSSDYAVFKLRRPLSRPTVTLERTEGVPNHTNLKLVKVDPGLDVDTQGRISVEDCRISYNTLLTPASNSPYSSVHGVLDCNVQMGNSGSPIMSEDLKTVKLVVQSFVKPNLDSLPTYFDLLLLGGPRFNFATNSVCIPDGTGKKSRKCEEISYISNQTFTKNYSEQALLQLSQKDKNDISLNLNQLRSMIPQSHFGYFINYSPSAVRIEDDWLNIGDVYVGPGCFSNEWQWLKNFRKGITSLYAYEDEAIVLSPIAHLTKQIRINQDAQLESKIKFEPTDVGWMEFRFSPRELAHKGESWVSVKSDRTDHVYSMPNFSSCSHLN